MIGAGGELLYSFPSSVGGLKADALAESLRATMEEIKESGTTSFSGIAKKLNAQKIKTARGGKWHPSSVKRLLERLG